MHFNAATLATLLLASIGAAQTVPQTKTFNFANNPGPQSLQEVANILLYVGQLHPVTVDAAASTVTVSGTPDELAMTAWIVRQLDQPTSNPAAVTASAEQYLVAGKADDVIQVFHLAHIPSTPPQGMQEALTVLRTVADVQRVFNYTALSDLVVRGPAAQTALAAYLIRSLDVAKGSVTTSPEYPYQAPGQASQVVKVFYLATIKAPQQIQEILTTLRTVADIQKIFNFTSLNALAICGSAGTIATAEWLIQSLDITSKPAPSAIRQFIMPENWPGGNTIRVFYPANINTPYQMQQTLTAIRTKLQIQKVFNYTALPGLVVRGSADQITKAEQLILEQDQLAKATP